MKANGIRDWLPDRAIPRKADRLLLSQFVAGCENQGAVAYALERGMGLAINAAHLSLIRAHLMRAYAEVEGLSPLAWQLLVEPKRQQLLREHHADSANRLRKKGRPDRWKGEVDNELRVLRVPRAVRRVMIRTLARRAPGWLGT